MQDIRQTPQYAKYLSNIGWKVEKIGKDNAFIKTLPIIGSIIKIQRPSKINLEEVNKLVNKYRVFQVVLEPTKLDVPTTVLNRNGFLFNKSPYLPTKTLIVDLTKSKSALHSALKKDTRYALRKTQSILLSEQKNIKKFHRRWQESVDFKRAVTSYHDLIQLKKAFGSGCLFLGNKDGSAGAIFLVAGKTGYYWQAFTSKKTRKTLIQYKIVWEGMLWAKSKGAKFFDFEGIFDERVPRETWKGFTHFKKGFGGKEVSFPGSFVKNLPPVKLFKLPKPIEKRLPLVFLGIAILIFYLSVRHTGVVIEFSKNHPLVAPLIIILWRILGVVIPPIPGGILALSMIPVFGWFWAFLYGAIGLLIGCCIAFMLARFYGPPLVNQFIPLEKLDRWEKKISEDTQFVAFLILRFTTGPILDFVSYVAGLSKISFMKFFIATAISILPDALYYYFGETIYRRGASTLMIAIFILIFFFFVLKKLGVFKKTSQDFE